jgi:hypothetical protein
LCIPCCQDGGDCCSPVCRLSGEDDIALLYWIHNCSMDFLRFAGASQVCGAKYVFGANAIQRMEVFVLSTLKWRMNSVTPFSYIDHFLDKLNAEKPLTHDLVSRCTKLILDTLKGSTNCLMNQSNTHARCYFKYQI